MQNLYTAENEITIDIVGPLAYEVGAPARPQLERSSPRSGLGITESDAVFRELIGAKICGLLIGLDDQHPYHDIYHRGKTKR